MIVVIFEVWPSDGQRDNYLALAADLKAELSEVDGFLSIERFESLTEPGKLRSLSFFRDEAAVEAWATGPRIVLRSRVAAEAFSATIACASRMFSGISA